MSLMKNVGTLDRVIRIVAGVGILAAGYFNQSWWGLVGVVPLLTATIAFCPAYRLIGLSTCPVKR
jgi:hypothetical protein